MECRQISVNYPDGNGRDVDANEFILGVSGDENRRIPRTRRTLVARSLERPGLMKFERDSDEKRRD